MYEAGKIFRAAPGVPFRRPEIGVECSFLAQDTPSDVRRACACTLTGPVTVGQPWTWTIASVEDTGSVNAQKVLPIVLR
jgi:hypothetical protein